MSRGFITVFILAFVFVLSAFGLFAASSQVDPETAVQLKIAGGVSIALGIACMAAVPFMDRDKQKEPRYWLVNVVAIWTKEFDLALHLNAVIEPDPDTVQVLTQVLTTIRDKARSKTLRIWGWREGAVGDTPMVEIPADHWTTFEISVDEFRDGRRGRSIDTTGAGRSGYTNLRFNSKEVRNGFDWRAPRPEFKELRFRDSV